jgi:MFS family permease
MLLTANGVIVFLFQYPVARWVNRWTPARGLALGGVWYGLGWLAMAWVGSFSWAFAVIFAVTAAEIVFTPLTLATVGRLAPWDKRGRYMGFFGLSQSLSMSLAPLAGGVLLDHFIGTPILIWAPIAMIGLAAAVGFHFWGKLGQDENCLAIAKQ